MSNVRPDPVVSDPVVSLHSQYYVFVEQISNLGIENLNFTGLRETFRCFFCKIKKVLRSEIRICQRLPMVLSLR